MSVSIQDLLGLPSLQQARVVAGKNGLNKTITSISVLESIDQDKLGFNFPGISNFFGHEAIITAFMDARNNVEKQCQTILRLKEEGEVAIILFYLGSIVSELSPEVIQLCDEIKMPLIVMPKKRLDLRYGDVIIEVCEAIVNDKTSTDVFTTEIIDILSEVPSDNRNMMTVLSYIRNMVHSSVFLLNDSYDILNYAEWPNGRNIPIYNIIEHVRSELNTNDIMDVLIDNNHYYFATEELTINQNRIIILIVKETPEIHLETRKQIKFVVRTYINLWAEGYGDIDSKQLLNSIIHGDNEKSFRMGQSLELDLSKAKELHMIFTLNDDHEFEKLLAVRDSIRYSLETHGVTSVCDIFDETIIVISGEESISDIIADAITYCDDTDTPFGVIRHKILSDINELRDVYWQFNRCRKHIPIVYPNCQSFTSSKLDYLDKALAIHLDENQARSITDKLTIPLKNCSIYEDLLNTLIVFLLDAECSVSKTAEIMYIHLNTVKYRLKKIEELLGYKPTSVPEIHTTYLASILLRIGEA